MALDYIHSNFENASPINWHIDADGVAQIEMIYDHERALSNRAAGHWHFQLHAKAGDKLTVVLRNFDNIWNGKSGSPISNRSNCYISIDGKKWSAIPAQKTPDNRLKIQLQMETDTLFLARLDPYRISDLDRFLAEICDHPLVAVTAIGHSVEGRDLEMVRIGRPDAPHRVLLRARSHPWEPGGNWLLQGLIKSLLEADQQTQRALDTYCVYAMPMAGKDGVARGHTRFNLLGMDLNRNWDRLADPHCAPENHALETWLQDMIDDDKRPHLAIDLHNDNSGKLHISRPEADCDQYLANMQRLEQLMLQHTWFREGSTGSQFRNPGTFGEGLLQRYGIDACILELNCDWIAGLQKVPLGKDWELLGAQMREVFQTYFENTSLPN
ncbi:MAG: peptidase M14 [Candidatus Latescibacteria bacterium]|nr:peptidase M14 [Candidatus Latescibacterota bacterium]